MLSVNYSHTNRYRQHVLLIKDGEDPVRPDCFWWQDNAALLWNVRTMPAEHRGDVVMHYYDVPEFNIIRSFDGADEIPWGDIRV